jgi:hypothetical protein
MDPRSASRPVGVALFLALTLAGGACGGDDESTTAGSTTTEGDGGAVGEVGTTIRDGFVVVEGSELIGPAFPIGVAYVHAGEPVLDEGFEAVLEVRGDPRPVIDGYLDQAQSLGLTDARNPVCGPDDHPEGVFSCSGFARSPDVTEPLSLSLSFRRGRLDDARGFSSLEMRYSTTSLDWDYGDGSATIDDDGTEAPEPPDDIDEPPDGSSLFESWPPVEPVDVVGGTEPLGVFPSTECSAFTPIALLEVTDDPATVLGAYADQFATITQDQAHIDPPIDVAGGRLHVAAAFAAGGVSYRAALYDTSSTDWLRIDSCYD